MVMALLFWFAAAGAARAADAPVAARPVALFVSGCPGVNETALRHMVAVEIGERLVAAGDPTPPNADRVIISCRAQLARLEAGDPGSPRHAERTLSLVQFKGKGDSTTRALALAALELLTALDRPPPPTAPAPPAPPPPPPPPGPDPVKLETYQREFVWFNDVVISGAWSSRRFMPYRGKYHEPLPGSDFYSAIDRPDLATRYNVWRGIQVGLEFGGAAVALSGLYLFHSHPTLGTDLFIGGGLASIVGLFLTPEIVDEQNARRLADEHNKRLKRQLGLAPVEPSPPRPVPINLRVSAAVAPNGAAAVAQLVF
jgi:hypothetical protein